MVKKAKVFNAKKIMRTARRTNRFMNKLYKRVDTALSKNRGRVRYRQNKNTDTSYDGMIVRTETYRPSDDDPDIQIVHAKEEMYMRRTPKNTRGTVVGQTIYTPVSARPAADTRQGHSLILHLFFGAYLLYIPTIYYAISKDHYFHL